MDIINAMRSWQGLSDANGPEELGLSPNCFSAKQNPRKIPLPAEFLQ